jgi:alpha-galactosidase
MLNSTSPKTRPANIDIQFYASDHMHTARYVSDLLVREEALVNGRWMGLYWSAGGQVQREDVTAALTHPDAAGNVPLDPHRQSLHTFELEIDGQALHSHWEWVDATEQSGGRPGTVEAVVELRHQLRPITLKIVTRLDGSAVLMRWLEITNSGSHDAALSHVSPWCGLLWQTEAAWNPAATPPALYSLGYMPAEKWGEEDDFTWQDLPAEHYRIERSNGRFHGSPYWVLRNNLSGESAIVALAWSGNHFADFAQRDNRLSFSAGPLGSAPLRVISPGETVRSPAVHLGLFHASTDQVIHKWHQHLRASVIPPRPAGKEMYTLGARVVEQPGEWILREIDMAAEMGCEAFMVDAGWYGDRFDQWFEQRGDWREGDWLPGGLKGIRDHIHHKGMLFGLWLEPEAMSAKSKLFQQHPDWALSADDGTKLGEFGYSLNLAHPDAARYVEESVLRVMREVQPDFYKTDYNITTYEGGQNVRGGFAEHETWRHFETLYQLYDRVRREYPHVALENCAGGGGRNDLGMLSRFHYCASSDYSTFPRSIRQINSLSHFLPPEAICYYHNHIPFAHLTADLDTHLRVTLFAVPLYVGFGAQNAQRDTPYFAATRRTIELAKTFCRPIMANHARVYHHTPDIGVFRPAEWCVLEYAAQDRSRAYAGIFRLSQTGADEYVFRPRGIDAGCDYRVTLDNTQQTYRVSGHELLNEGVRVLLDAPLTSELLLFEAME